MTIFGLNIIDIAVVVVCVVAILSVGIWASRGVKKETDYFAGGRQMGPVLQFFLSFASMTDPAGAPLVATEVYRQGAGGLWPTYEPLFRTPLYWFSAIWYRRTRLITGSEFFLERFNSRKLAMALVLWNLMLTPFGAGMGCIVSYKVAAAMITKPESSWTASEHKMVQDYRKYQALKAEFRAGQIKTEERGLYQSLDDRYKKNELNSYVSYVTPLPFYIAYTLLIISYILFGGIKAAAYTNAIQGVLIIVLSVLLIPLGLIKTGGFSGLHQSVPEHMFNLFGSTGLSDYSWHSIGAFLLMGVLSIGLPIVNPTGRDETSMRVGIVGAAFAKRIVMLGWILCGLLAVALFPNNSISDPDNAWGKLSEHLLGPGLLGLMISGVLLGHMPGVATQAIQFSAMFTRNLYEPLLPRRSPEHYMWVARLSIIGVLLASIVTAMLFTNIMPMFTSIVAICALLGAIGLLMLFWRGLTALATGITWSIGVLLLVVIPWTLPHFERFSELTALTVQTNTCSIQSKGIATSEDVAVGRAGKKGDLITNTQLIPPAALYFDEVVRVNSGDSQSPLRGMGRFHVENYLLHLAGLPLERFSHSGLLTARWLFDALFPFVLLIGLSLLLPHRNKSVGPCRALRPEEYAKVIMQGNIGEAFLSNETAEEEKIRLDRFFAKQRTPIAPTSEEDERVLAETFACPQDYDHLKLFPTSQWEFSKWSRNDTLGFGACCGGVVVILGLLWLALGIGA
jgi:Na+/proline symporter